MKEKTMQQYENIFFQILDGKERISTPSWKLPTAVTGCHNLALIYEGEAVFYYNNEEYSVSKGDLIYYKQGVSRSIMNQKDNPVRFFAIDFYFVMPSFNEVWEFTENPMPFEVVERIQDSYLFSRLVGLFKRFVNIWTTEKYNQQIRSRSILNEIFQLLLLWKQKEDFSYDSIRRVEKVICYLQENYQKKIFLKDLAAMTGITDSYLCDIFRRNVGKSPIEYLVFIRVQKACELLQNGHSVTVAAQETGFSDIYYFSKCFKQVQGLSPSKYKELFMEDYL